MTERPSYSNRRRAPILALVGFLVAWPAPTAAQDDLDAACVAAPNPPECRLALSAARLIQPRVGLALWGGNPVPGTASTAGLRLGSSPRLSFSSRVLVAPTTVPPLVDRARTDGSLAVITGGSVQASVGVSHGYSPLPTVGGFLSLDLIGRASYAYLPGGPGFQGPVFGWAAGARLGLFRESLTLPGVAVSALYGRSTRVELGDLGGGTDGAMEGSVSGLHASAAASRRIFGLRLTGGVAWDRYGSGVGVRYGPAPGGSGPTVEADAALERWGAFGSLTWTRLVYHGVLEAGWQETPTLARLPADVDLTAIGWWAGLSFRLTP